MLLDGLDEVADPAKRARIVEVIAACTRHYQGNRFVVTSRPRGYEGEAKQRLASLYGECTIRDFDDEDMAAFARNWYEAVIRDRLGDIPEATAEAQRQADDLLRAIRADERVKALAPNPLLLSILAMVHQRGVGLPQRRAELYDECTDMLLGYWDQTKGGEAARELATLGELTRNEKRTLLQPITLWFHERGEQGLEAGKEELEREIARQFAETFGDTENKARYRAALFLRVIDERAGLLVERETGVYAFSHLTFQEYLAARTIADRDNYIEYTLRHLHDPWWREVILLEVGHLSDVRHVGRRVRKLTSDLICAIRNAGSWLEDVLKRDLLFAARCLCDTGKLGVDDELRQSLMDELITLWHTTPYESQRREVVEVFASAMSTVDGPRIRVELLCCLNDTDENKRLVAAQALERIGTPARTPEITERLLALATAVDRSVHIEAVVGALVRVGTEEAIREVINRLHALTTNPNAAVRASAVWALRKMGKAAATPETVERLLHMTTDSEGKVRWPAVLALTAMGQATKTVVIVERLLALTTDPERSVRVAAVRALGEIGEVAPAATVERLLTLTTDPDETTRWLAVSALVEIGETAATTAVVKRLLALTRDTDTGVRSSAIWALGALGEAAAAEKTLRRLFALTVDSDEVISRTAVWALGQMDMAATADDISGRLTEFWQIQLRDVEYRDFGGFIERGCNIAYQELRRIAAQRERKPQL